MRTTKIVIICLGLGAASCGKKSSSTTSGGTTASDGGTGGTSGGYSGAVGTIALSITNLAGTSGTSLVGGPLGLTGTPTVGEEISMTPTSYLVSVKDIFVENSAKTNSIVSTTASGTTSSATSLALTTGSGTSSGTGAPTVLGYSGIVDPNFAYVYKCSGTTESACAVDLANNETTAALFKEAQNVPVGTFDTIGYDVVCDESLTSGGSSGGFHVGVAGTVTIGGTVYYTTSGSSVLSTSASDLSPTLLPIYGGCGQTTFKLPSVITVTADESVSVNLYLSADHIAWAGIDGVYNPGGCAASGDNFVCTNLPAFVPTAGGFTPTFQLYDITVSPGSSPTGGQVAVLLDSESDAIGAFLMRYYTAAQLSNAALWDAGVVSFSKNSDGSYDIASSTDPKAAGPRCEFKNFELLPSISSAAATGTVDNAGSPLTYSATRTQ